MIGVEELGAGGAETGGAEGGAERGEVAGELGGGGDEGGVAVRDVANLGLLVAEEEEGVVAPDGAADYAAELIALERVDGFYAVDVAEVVGCVEDAVADELEEIAVEGVGAGFGDGVDDSAGVSAVAGGVVGGLDAELLEGVGEGEGLIDVGVDVVIGGAVEVEAGLVGAGAVGGDGDGDGDGLVLALVGSVGRRLNGAGDEERESDGVATVRGKVDDALFFDDLREGGTGGVDLKRVGFDGDGLGSLADLHLNAEGETLVGEEGDVGLGEVGEAGGGGGDVVGGGMKGGDDEITLVVGDDGAGYSCAFIGDGDLDAGITLPEGSVTVPTRVPKPWATAGLLLKMKVIAATSSSKVYLADFM